MTVRWKPLIVLSGLFLIVAVFGLLAITMDLLPANAAEILPQARKEWKKNQFGNAQIQYLRALQQDPRNAKIHFELARLYEDWAAHEPDKKAKLRAERIESLKNAAKFGKDPEPRRLLLAEAQAREDLVEAVQCARRLLDAESDAPDAHYTLADAALETTPPDIALAEKHLAALEAAQPDRPRTVWLQARLAKVNANAKASLSILDEHRDLKPKADADATDRLALLKLRQLDALATPEAAPLATRIHALQSVAAALADDPEASPPRLTRIGRLIDEVQKHQSRIAAAGKDEEARRRLDTEAKALEAVAETCYKKALGNPEAADLGIHEEYAAHLLEREDRAHCLEVIGQALKLPAATLPAWAMTVTRLHEIAIKAALRDDKDADRFTLAEPHIKELIRSSAPDAQAVGHLFQGIIELDRSGLVEANRAASAAVLDTRLRGSALAHLKAAAAGLKESPTAQALYGVGLMLTGEQGLGRQYLLSAIRLPGLDPRYQVWSAWAMIQAGYPEDAEPIVKRLLDAIQRGEADHSLESTLRLLTAEIHQARRTPADLAKARTAFQQALSDTPGSPVLELRLAQLDVLLGEPKKGLERVNALRARGDGGAAAEHLAVLILSDLNQPEQAAQALAAGRKRFPDSSELVALAATLDLKQQKPEDADRTLAEFLTKHPKDFDILQMRARLLTDSLKRPDDARKLLTEAAESAETSGPIVQLALLEISQNDPKAAAAAIGKVRARWKEAALPDLLDAQLAMSRNEPRAALGFLDAALKKDPSNKLALFWKAQLDNRAGDPAEAARIYESLAREKSGKEIDEGLSLANAANWALATLALENQDPDAAISRLEGLLKDGLTTQLDRPVRWQLVTARAAKGQWPAAKAEIEALLKSPRTTNEERVRAANLHRLNNEPDRAQAILDAVLKADPTLTSAAALRAYLLADKHPDQAAALLRKTLAAGKQPTSIHLMLAALENGLSPTEGPKKALAVVDDALKTDPDAIELVQARYRLLRISGDPSAAIAYVTQRAEGDDPKGRFRRFLVDVLRDEGRYADAAAVLRALMKETPDDPALAEMLVRMIGLQAMTAKADPARGDHKSAKALDDEANTLLHEFRTRFPNHLAFLQIECENAARDRQFDRAIALTQEIDKRDANSPIGPMLRGQIAALRGWTEESAKEYGEAVSRAPRRADLRLALAQTSLVAGKSDEAVKQANWVLDSNPDQTTATLVKARALANQNGTPEQVRAARGEALTLLRKVQTDHPKLAAAPQLIAEIQLLDDQRDQAIQTLATHLQSNRDDAESLTMLISLLCEPRRQGRHPTPQELKQADELAERFAAADATGKLKQAVSVGFHKGGQIDRGLNWAAKAAALLDDWKVHQNHGDLLMAKAEGLTDPATARPLFEQAVEQYDKVLKANPASVEAVNNKSWVLTQYLGRAAEALALAEALVKRSDPAALPPDFYDTLGTIHEALRHPKDAEAAYLAGLKRASDHPILNFHMGRLIAADPARAASAASFLQKARDARELLTPAMASELDSLLARANP